MTCQSESLGMNPRGLSCGSSVMFHKPEGGNFCILPERGKWAKTCVGHFHFNNLKSSHNHHSRPFLARMTILKDSHHYLLRASLSLFYFVCIILVPKLMRDEIANRSSKFNLHEKIIVERREIAHSIPLD